MKFAVPALAFVAVASALPQTTSTPPPSFEITNVVSGGTGCPQGSIDVNWTDNKILPIYFGKEFIAAVGPKAEITDSRKFCQLNLQLEYSAGYSFAVYSADYSGFAYLDNGVTGTVKSTYYFSGSMLQTSSALVLSGPTKAKFNKQDDIAVSVWSPCSGDALFNVDASVALTPLASPASGVLGITKESGKLRSNLYIQWKKC
ncbi:hypothetical protein BU25DRAFT_439961 [Macroventuria anomochaeta]|uniref:Uncharacterized protein n=1 Tax=Macroventuria anomochaeta TaxID=301207 RepID=A0ACB6RZT8_9PLEO|nr:uncharacterized protein BU25DRAFT_439961 [Macroventuria anomochaeta]KAF2627545.1 hypothetical protein BU25DRAFT_439961 [Macroventuria anomochaeta]